MAGSRRSFFFRHILFSIAILWGLIAIGVVIAAPLAIHLSLFKPDLNGHHVKAIAEVLEAKAGTQAPERVIANISHSPKSSGEFFLLDDEGKLVANSRGATIDFVVNPKFLPQVPGRARSLNDLPPGPGEPAVIKLRGLPARYLIFKPQSRTGPEAFMMIAILGFLSVIVIVAMGGSSYILIAKLKKHAHQAGAVMTRLQKGELGARLIVERQDEFGEMMTQFNLMAEQVESLFARVREVEQARIHLLQDIGHDLRTPLGSLLNIFELLHDKSGQLTDSEKREFLSTGRREVKFTERLVEDLLFLARVEDPACQKREEIFDLSQLVNDEIEAKRALSDLTIACAAPDSLTVLGDGQLLKRLLRNGLSNSLSYAKERISVCVKIEPSALKIHIDDDGPGFSEAALQSFGARRPTRIFHEHQGSRISLGLGSVIMVAIARLYSGSVRPSNLLRDGGVVGGRLTISLNLPVIADRKAHVA